MLSAEARAREVCDTWGLEIEQRNHLTDLILSVREEARNERLSANDLMTVHMGEKWLRQRDAEVKRVVETSGLNAATKAGFLRRLGLENE
jgi:hypothetical protein